MLRALLVSSLLVGSVFGNNNTSNASSNASGNSTQSNTASSNASGNSTQSNTASSNASGNSTQSNTAAANSTQSNTGNNTASSNTTATATANTTAAAANTTKAATTKAATTKAATTKAATTAAATTAAGNSSNATTAAPAAEKASFDVDAGMTLELDVSNYTDDARKAIGSSLAYGIHKTLCDLLMNDKVVTDAVSCLTGVAAPGNTVSFAASIDTKLTAAISPCNSKTDCYGMDLSRRLAAQSFTNSGKMSITTEKTKAKKMSGEVKAKSNSATEKAATLNLIKTAVGVALNKNTKIPAAAKVAVNSATANATITIGATEPTTTATSGAFSFGITGAVAFAAGMLLF